MLRHRAQAQLAATTSDESVIRSSGRPREHALLRRATSGWAAAGFHDLRDSRVLWRCDEPDARQQLELTVDGHVLDDGHLDPFPDRVVVLVQSVVQLLALDIGRFAGEEVVAAALVEVEVRVDDDADSGQVEVGLLAQWGQVRMSSTAGCSCVMPVSTSTRAWEWSMTCT